MGIIAGSGALPEIVAQAALRQGRRPFVLALSGAANASLEAFPHCWINIGELGRGIALLQERYIRDVVFVGQVHRPSLGNFRGDWDGWKFLLEWVVKKRSSDDQLLQALQKHLEEREGFRILPAQEVCESLTVAPGFLGCFQADDEAQGDIAIGVKVAQTMGSFDIGQGVVVCRRLILAVEAQEQTDSMLRRVADMGAELRGTPEGRAGVFVKLPKPRQTRELDWPVIGETTVIEASRAGLAGIVLQAGGCLLTDAESIARRIDAEGMFLLSLSTEKIAALHD